jgi:hypothetical protein
MKKKLTSARLDSTASSTKSTKESSVLDEIQKKITSSAALNGGFDTLLYKIDKIEQSQGQLVTKVDKIHEAIYDPQEGIFSKLSEYKLENTNKINDINQSITEFKVWQDYRNKEELKEEEDTDTSKKKIDRLERSVDNLVKSKQVAWSVLKWLGVAIGGGVITLLFGWLETKIK